MNDKGSANDTDRHDEPEPPDTDARIEQLRAMQEAGEQLDETIEEAREAVHAAHEANTMRSPGAHEPEAEDEGPQRSG